MSYYFNLGQGAYIYKKTLNRTFILGLIKCFTPFFFFLKEIKHFLQLFMEYVLFLPVSLILNISTASSIAIFEKLKVLKRQPLQFHLSYQSRKVKMKD